MWRLEYWHPARQVAVDSMHCIFENLVQDHFRHFLGLTTKLATTGPAAHIAFTHPFKVTSLEEQLSRDTKDRMTEKEIKQVTDIHTLLVAGPADSTFDNYLSALERKLQGKNLKPLQFVFQDLGLVIPDTTYPAAPFPVKKTRLTKKDVVGALLQWVSFFLIHSYALINQFQSNIAEGETSTRG
jgi:hypothetical protein